MRHFFRSTRKRTAVGIDGLPNAPLWVFTVGRFTLLWDQPGHPIPERLQAREPVRLEDVIP